MHPSKDNAHQRVAASLFDSIRKGRFAPGARVSARALSAELGTSITPVREVLLKLEALGAVRGGIGGALHIPIRAADEIQQIYSARIALEGTAAAEAAGRIDERELDELRRLDAATFAAQSANDLRAMLALNEELHFRIYAAARNDTLLDLINLLWLRCGPLLPHVYGFYKVARDQFSGEVDHRHSALIAALERRDAAAARQLIAEDIGTGLAVYRALTVDLEATIAELTQPAV